MNSEASQSSNSGWLGHSPCEPKSFSTLERPVPKNCCHIRLAKTLAVSGFSGDTSQLAKSRRLARRLPVSNFPRNIGTAGWTTLPESSIQFARGRIRVSLGCTDTETNTVGTADWSMRRSAFSRSAGINADCKSGWDHWKYPRRVCACSLERLAGLALIAFRTSPGTPSCTPPLGSFSVSSGRPASTPASPNCGQEYCPDDSAKRIRPMVARRTGEFWRKYTVITAVGPVLTGRAKRKARNGLFPSPSSCPHAVLASPSIAAMGGCSPVSPNPFVVARTNLRSHERDDRDRRT